MEVTAVSRATQVAGVIGRIRRQRPGTVGQLAAYVKAFLGLDVPGEAVCAGHNSPLDYLAFSVLGDAGGNESTETAGRGDCVVWANRGGGKTQLGAVASLLECLFVPGCQVRILGGSQEQSQRMYQYLRAALGGQFVDQVAGAITADRCRFGNGSDVQVLAQSDRSVRGHHVQRLRCDEVELFDPEIYQAAQFITQSKNGIPAKLEVFSTMHRPGGLMGQVVGSANDNGMRLFRWCLWEVIERCVGRNCSRCCLWSDCQGKAKRADGYYLIDDAIAQKRRASAYSWQAEMLCERPNRHEVVFSEFDAARHVRPISYDSNLPLYRSMDFGFSNPLVCLFIQVDAEQNVWVIDEHIKSRTTLAEHARLIKERYPQPIAATYCDPAGKQHHEITGTNVVTELRALGIPVRYRSSKVLDGIEMIRNNLAPADGSTRLLISPSCSRLIEALECLRYKKLPNGSLSEVPDKDGVHDHLIDALRYFFINRFARKHALQEVRY